MKYGEENHNVCRTNVRQRFRDIVFSSIIHKVSTKFVPRPDIELTLWENSTPLIQRPHTGVMDINVACFMHVSPQLPKAMDDPIWEKQPYTRGK